MYINFLSIIFINYSNNIVNNFIDFELKKYFNLLFANDTNYFNTILYWVCWIDIFNPIFSTDLILQLYLF